MIKKEIKEADILALAFLGDAVYELMVRRTLALSNKKVKELHNLAIHFVSAKSQSEDLEYIEPLLEEEELAIVRRARNKNLNAPKHTKIQDYARATGFEALFGALYLSEETERLEFLFDEIKRRRTWI